MFFTIGLVTGFILGWYINEKFEDIIELKDKLKFWNK